MFFVGSVGQELPFSPGDKVFVLSSDHDGYEASKVVSVDRTEVQTEHGVFSMKTIAENRVLLQDSGMGEGYVLLICQYDLLLTPTGSSCVLQTLKVYVASQEC